MYQLAQLSPDLCVYYVNQAQVPFLPQEDLMDFLQ